MRLIGFARTTTGGNDFVPGNGKARNEEGANVTGRADYNDPDGYCLMNRDTPEADRGTASKVAVNRPNRNPSPFASGFLKTR
jgi:hypothetical protein